MLKARKKTVNVSVKTVSLRSFFSRLSSLKSSTKFLNDTILLMLLSFICTNISRKYPLCVSCHDTFENIRNSVKFACRGDPVGRLP